MDAGNPGDVNNIGDARRAGPTVAPVRSGERSADERWAARPQRQWSLNSGWRTRGAGLAGSFLPVGLAAEAPCWRNARAPGASAHEAP